MHALTPRYRQHTAKEVEYIVQQCRRAERMDNDPLRSIGVFAEANPDSVFAYVQHVIMF